ncbi:MAG: hypothetical protein L0H79_04060 [Intrasporangium sp.]|uniref:hypothetical protein n=1 Tax=Intrasporangium sp. TaxID=1925024 RepID=UPI00264967BA|nr:hypothetical protein [Intrasporangium sp.]MDN5794907.1 hypothetical protein [Intrasporangium sp.]
MPFNSLRIEGAPPIDSAPLPIDSALVLIDSALVLIDSAIVLIESAPLPIDSALVLIESAIVLIESALRRTTPRSSPPKVLGDTQPSMTTDLYGHVMPSSLRAARRHDR